MRSIPFFGTGFGGGVGAAAAGGVVEMGAEVCGVAVAVTLGS